MGATGGNDSPSARDDLVQLLHELGFSQYEARCYVGLLGQEPQTGYSVAKATGVPQRSRLLRPTGWQRSRCWFLSTAGMPSPRRPPA